MTVLSSKGRIRTYTRSGVWGKTTLDGLVRRTAEKDPERMALIDPPNKDEICGLDPLRLNYGEAEAIIDNLAANFRELGLKPDDIAAVQLPNIVETVLVMLAAMRAGLIVASIPVMWREYEMNAALPQIAPRALITAANINGHDHGSMMRNVAVDLMPVRFVMGIGEGLPDGVMPLDMCVPDEQSVSGKGADNANAIAAICWPVDGASQPRPVPRSHNQLISAGMMLMLEAGLAHDTSILNPWPLTGLLPLGVLSAWALSGGTLVQHHPFNADVFVAHAMEEKTGFTYLPASAGQLFSAKDRKMLHKQLNVIGCIQSGHIQNNEFWTDYSGTLIDIDLLGEFAFLARQRIGESANRRLPFGKISKPEGSSDGANLLEARIFGSSQNPGFSAGNLAIRSPMIFDNYFDDVSVINKDGFADTGIKSITVEGKEHEIELLRTADDIIRHGGVPVSAGELDALYASHENLADAAALPFEDPVMGKRIIAAVVPKPGGHINFEEFKEYLMSRKVASYKIPERIVTVKIIPRGKSGEVLRDQVLDEI